MQSKSGRGRRSRLVMSRASCCSPESSGSRPCRSQSLGVPASREAELLVPLLLRLPALCGLELEPGVDRFEVEALLARGLLGVEDYVRGQPLQVSGVIDARVRGPLRLDFARVRGGALGQLAGGFGRYPLEAGLFGYLLRQEGGGGVGDGGGAGACTGSGSSGGGGRG